MINWGIAFLFTLALLGLFRSYHQGGSAAKKAGKDASKNTGSSFKGRGGFGDMMGMGKSNVQVFGIDKKIKTRFKHVAGME